MNKTPSRFYQPEMDILRFFAFLCIFVFHTANAAPKAGRFDGIRSAAEISLSFAVSLFFMLSAYLITSLLEIELEATGKVHVGAFYVRRTVRIWPLYYLALLLCVGLGFVHPSWRLTGGTVAAFALFVGNWSSILHGMAVGPVIVLWSVNIEEQFYLLCPLAVALVKKRGLAALAVTTLIAAYATLVWLGHRHIWDDTSIRFNTLVEMQCFAAGTLLALLVRRRKTNLPVLLRMALLLGGLCCWIAGTYFFDSRVATSQLGPWSPASEQMLVLMGCIAIFFSFAGVRTGKAARPFIYLGKISYGLYVFHLMFIALLRESVPLLAGGGAHKIIRIGASFALTVTAAATSYTWFERPFLRLKERFTFVKSRAA